MTLKIAIVKETAPHERRVAASPDTVKKLIAQGYAVCIETGAGQSSSFTDDAFMTAGATIAPNFAQTVAGASLVLKVQAPSKAEIASLPKGCLLIGLLAPYAQKTLAADLAAAGIDSLSMEFIPRISRAQAMDALSSQSNLAGYRAVLDAAEHYPHAFPMMMTAAGTLPPAKVFVMGAGVAGLQAIATARRLGAVVSATDVRPAAKEQVASLGAAFIAVEDEEFKHAETSGGYAKEMSPEYKAKQAALVEAHIAKQDIVITTALIPGRPAPKLLSTEMVHSMKPGSVIVDLAVETGGNCALSEAGKVVEINGIKIIGHINVPSRIPADASALYAKNILALLGLLIDKDTKALTLNEGDEIIKAALLTRGGAIVHPQFLEQDKPKKKKKEQADG